MDIISMLDVLESLSGTNDPEHRIMRELEKLKNIGSVDHIEAVNMGLAQCCAYVRFIRAQPQYRSNDVAFISKLSQLIEIMTTCCDVHTTTQVRGNNE